MKRRRPANDTGRAPLPAAAVPDRPAPAPTLFPPSGSQPHLAHVQRVKGIPALTERLLATKEATASITFQLVATPDAGRGWDQLPTAVLARAALTSFAEELQRAVAALRETEGALSAAEVEAAANALQSDWAAAPAPGLAPDPAQLRVEGQRLPKYNKQGHPVLVVYEFNITYPAALRRAIQAHFLYASGGYLLLRPEGFPQPLLATLLCAGDALPRPARLPQACMLVATDCPVLPMVSTQDLLDMFLLDKHAQVLWLGRAAPAADGSCVVTDVARPPDAQPSLHGLTYAIMGTDIPLPGLQEPPHGFVALIAGGRHLLPAKKQPGKAGHPGGFVYVAEEGGVETEVHVRVARIPTRVSPHAAPPPAADAAPADNPQPQLRAQPLAMTPTQRGPSHPPQPLQQAPPRAWGPATHPQASAAVAAGPMDVDPRIPTPGAATQPHPVCVKLRNRSQPAAGPCPMQVDAAGPKRAGARAPPPPAQRVKHAHCMQPAAPAAAHPSLGAQAGAPPPAPPVPPDKT